MIIKALKHLKEARKFFIKKYVLINNSFSKLLAEKVDLLIYDNIYPHPVSGFRLEEFTVLLIEFEKSKIVLDPTAYKIIGTPEIEHKNHIFKIIQQHQQLKLKILFNIKNIYKVNIFYCVFLNNILNNLEWLECQKVPFIFTLYPGGGFKVNDEKTDASLQKVFKSPMFRKVIVTQDYTQKYLLERKLCEEKNILFIFGCVVPQHNIGGALNNNKKYLIEKDSFDICFCAAKYTKYGEDKGYDVFMDFAHNLSKRYAFVKFHIIGGFDKNDIDIKAIEDRIHFYGYQNFENLKPIFLSMDVIVSPNKPFVLSEGAFDGFPLGTVVEAALNGVVAIVSDPLNQNEVFIDGEDLLIIEADSISIEKEIVNLIENPALLYSISERGQKKFSEVYSNNVQMKPRIELLWNEILNYN